MDTQNHKHTHHITPVKTYLFVGITLLFLTAITVWIAQFDFGKLNMVVAMVVATIKALLVAMIFMGLKYDKKIYSVSVLISLVAVGLFIVFSMLDIFTRTSIYDYQMQEIRKDAIIYDNQEPNNAP